MWHDFHEVNPLPAAAVGFVVGLWLLVVLAWLLPLIPATLLHWWRRSSRRGRIAGIVILAVATLDGADKGSATSQLFSMLFWHPSSVWQLDTTQKTVAATVITNAASAEAARQALAVAASNSVWTFSFDWHAPDRLPYHAAQNVMGWTAKVAPTNINGTLCEDHYVAFNASASTNPAVILIEYASRRDDGTVERYSQPVLTNSYPNAFPVTLQSGVHTCYWFRCEVPPAFTNRLRDWNGEALFGSPEGSGKGFDVLGTLVVDDGNDVWVGATTNIVFGGVTNAVRNGIIGELDE